MQNLISNSCVGAFLYYRNKQVFDNPFMWTKIEIEDYISLIKNFDTIDFNNIDFSFEHMIVHGKVSPYKSVVGYLDNKVKLHYMHYIKSKSYDNPTRLGGMNIYGNNIMEYAREKYFIRLSRMNRSPTFLCNLKVRDDEKYQRYITGLLEIETNHPLYILTYKSKRNKVYHKKHIHILYVNDDILNSGMAVVARYVHKYYPFLRINQSEKIKTNT